MRRTDEVWKSSCLARTFLENVRGGIPFGGEQIEMMLRVIDAGQVPVKSFADLGCGDGILAGAILARHPRARGVLVDFSSAMLDAARKQLGDRAGRLRFIRADLATADWSAAAREVAPFDVVMSGYAIHHQPDARKQELYREVFGLLRPGGIFVNIEHVASRTPWVGSISDELLIDCLHAFQRRQGSRKSRRRVATEFVHRPDKAANILSPVETQCGWLRAIGFEDVDCYFKVFELAVFGGRRKSG